MCGYIPATVALIAARALGATRATVVGYVIPVLQLRERWTP